MALPDCVRENLQACLPRWVEEGRTAVLYAAGGLTRTLLESGSLEPLRVLGIVDRNPALKGTCLSGCPVRPVETLREDAPDLVLVASPNHHHEIVRELTEKLQGTAIEIIDLADPRRLAARILPPEAADLTLHGPITGANLEFTTQCNLRCVYCTKSHPDRSSEHTLEFPEARIQEVMGSLKAMGLTYVVCSGIGETSTRKGWDGLCRAMLDLGISLSIITNLARPLVSEELATLARFASVQLSIDTSDPDLFAKIRRGAKLPQVAANLDGILAAAADLPKQPELCFDIVVTDQTVLHLTDLIRFGLSHGVSVYYFADLCELGDVPGAFNVHNVSKLAADLIPAAIRSLEAAGDLARAAGGTVVMHPSLLENLRHRLTHPDDGSVLPAPEGWGATPPGEGWTRNCDSPWTYAFLRADGTVGPCCAYELPLGNLHDRTIAGILDDPPVRTLRSQLLSGRLEGTLCHSCAIKPRVPIPEFRSRILELRLDAWKASQGESEPVHV